MRRIILSLGLLASSFAQTPFVPNTTLQKETGNNTSASNSVSAYTSSHAASGNVSKEPISKLLYAGATTKVYAALMGWFGKGGHIAVGYNSQDAAQVRKQVEDMQSRGVDGAILAWYGKNSYENKTALALKAQAEAHPGFEFVIMIDHGTIQWDSMGLAPTDALIEHLNYVADIYYPSPAYGRVNGRPVILEFALESYTIDWARVRGSIRGNPMIIFRNPNGWTKPFSDGAYSWEPEKIDMSYLDYFYSQAKNYPLLQTYGSLSPSFNDSLATWTANRYADGQCGQLWLKKAAEANKYWSAAKQLPFIQIATWNDYEEGSTIESGIDNCIGVTAQSSGSIVTWSLTGLGNANTVDHFTIFVSQDGQNLMPVGDMPASSRAADLGSVNLAAGNYSAFVKAVGKPSLLNHMSNAVAVTLGTQVSPPAPAADYRMTTPETNVTISSALPASIVLNTATVSGPASTVNFACTSAPAWAQCSFSPVSVKTGDSTTLMIRAVQSASMDTSNFVMLAILVALLSAAWSNRRGAKKVSAIAAICTLSTALVACGGGARESSATPQAQTSQPVTTSSITVVATPSEPSLPTRSIVVNVTLTK